MSFQRLLKRNHVPEAIWNPDQSSIGHESFQDLLDAAAYAQAAESSTYPQEAPRQLEDIQAAFIMLQIARQGYKMSDTTENVFGPHQDIANETEDEQQRQYRRQGTRGFKQSRCPSERPEVNAFMSPNLAYEPASDPEEQNVPSDTYGRLYLSRRAERDLRSPQDTMDESEGDNKDQDKPKDTTSFVQWPIFVHGTRECRARCRNKCNGKRKINALIQEGYTIIEVCEPDCSDAKPPCPNGCDYIKQYNADISQRFLDDVSTPKIGLFGRLIKSLKRQEQRQGANDTLIRRVESRIDTLKQQAEIAVTTIRKFAESDNMWIPHEEGYRTDQEDVAVATQGKDEQMPLAPGNDISAAFGGVAPESPYDSIGRRRGDKTKRDVEYYQEYYKQLPDQGSPAKDPKADISISSSRSVSEEAKKERRNAQRRLQRQHKKSLIVKFPSPSNAPTRLDRLDSSTITPPGDTTAGPSPQSARSCPDIV